MLEKLNRLDFRGKCDELLKSYSSGRKQFTVGNDTVSDLARSRLRALRRLVRQKCSNLGPDHVVIYVRVVAEWPLPVPGIQRTLFYGSLCGAICSVCAVVRARRPLVIMYF